MDISAHGALQQARGGGFGPVNAGWAYGCRLLSTSLVARKVWLTDIWPRGR
jgi:hypothetical protein